MTKKKEKEVVNKALDKFNTLYSGGGLVNLGEHPRYPEKVLTGRPSIDYVTDGGIPKGRLVLIAGEPSAGKCLGKGTEILMYNGVYKKVEDIVVGDLVMGVDSMPRIVCNTSKGEDDLYIIRQNRGIDYIVNSNHTLTLIKKTEPRYSRFTNENGKREYDYSKCIREYSEDIINIRAIELLEEKKKAPSTFRRKYFGVKRPDIRYEKKQLNIPPYLMGLWLADGTNGKPEITNSDPEIEAYIKSYCENNGYKLTSYVDKNSFRYNIVTERGKDNPFLNFLREYNVINNKHIPLDYLTSSLEDRLELLAGILDADGYLNDSRSKHYFDILQKNEEFIKNIKQLAESCGFICSEVSRQKKKIRQTGFEGHYYRINITGNLGIIPNKVHRKISDYIGVKDSDYYSGIDIEYIGKGEYYGFEVDGDSMFMLRDQTITHNSSLTIQLAELIGKKILYIDTEMTLTSDYIEALGADPYKITHAIPSTTEELCNIVREQIPNFDVIIIDSINNSASGEQLQKTADERTMANRAIVLSAQLPIMVGLCNQHNTTLIILSQIRDNMNKANKYSPDTIVPGGKSLHHNSSMTLELFKSSLQKSKDIDPLSNKKESVDGNMVRIRCTKNKVGKVNREVSIKFTYGKGYTEESDIASSAIRLGILTRSGSWYKYGETSIAQGEDNIAPVLENNPELLEELRSKIEELTKEE